MNHFFIDPAFITNSKIQFPDDVSHQIARVLRLKTETTVVVLDNLENQYEVKLVEINARQCIGEILNQNTINTEPDHRLHLYIALTQREKFEWILQKCCELGVSIFTPVLTDRSIVTSVDDYQKKKERWHRILKEAAEQSRRGKIPVLNDPIDFEKATNCPAQLKLIAWEGESETKITEILFNAVESDIVLMVGPEGGLSEKEIHIAKEKGWKTFSLGKRILRMETAAIVASALVLHTAGDM
jgi:16S rRNA (uracil1498-N3)-methyltransferase